MNTTCQLCTAEGDYSPEPADVVTFCGVYRIRLCGKCHNQIMEAIRNQPWYKDLRITEVIFSVMQSRPAISIEMIESIVSKKIEHENTLCDFVENYVSDITNR